MTDVEHLTGARILVDQCTKMAMLLTIEDARLLVNESNYVGTVSPFIDPTWAMQNMDNMRIRDQQFRAFLDFRQELERIKGSL